MDLSLQGRHVILRDFRANDVDDVLSIVGDNTVTVWLSFDSRNRVDTERMLTAAIDGAKSVPRTEYHLGITLPPAGRVIGLIRLALGGVKAAKLGYAINADYWGRGHATDAIETILRFAFTNLDLHRITAAIGPDNAPSQHIVKKLGFSYEGRLRDHVFTNRAWRDSLLFSLLSHEWSESSASSRTP
jgi:ribosomal-protein-alanine N-acetyltransferase